MAGVDTSSLAKMATKELQLLHEHSVGKGAFDGDASALPNFERMHQPHKLTSFDRVFAHDFATPISLPKMSASSDSSIHDSVVTANYRLAMRFSGSVCDATAPPDQSRHRDVVSADDMRSSHVYERKLSTSHFKIDQASSTVLGTRRSLSQHSHEIQTSGPIKPHQEPKLGVKLGVNQDGVRPHDIMHRRDFYGTPMHSVGDAEGNKLRCSQCCYSKVRSCNRAESQCLCCHTALHDAGDPSRVSIELGLSHCITQPRVLSAISNMSSTDMQPGNCQIPPLRVDSCLVAYLRASSTHISEYGQYCEYCGPSDTWMCTASEPCSRADSKDKSEFIALMRERDLKHTDVDAIVSTYSAAGIAREITCGVFRGACCSMSASSITSMVSSESLNVFGRVNVLLCCLMGCVSPGAQRA